MSINSENKFVYVPLTQAYPVVFADVVSVPIPSNYGPTVMSPELWGILSKAEHFTVRQHVKFLPKRCCSCPPCAPQENTYSLYAGLTKDAEAEIMRFDEVSDDWNRCCCKPYQPFYLEGRQYVPVPGDNTNSDFSHILDDFRNDWGRLAKGDKQRTLTNLYKNYPPLVTIVRRDGQRCCYKCPCKVLSTFVCCGCCQDGVDVYMGALQTLPDVEKGRPLVGTTNAKIASVIQPNYGGCYRPLLHILQPDDPEPYAKVEGPLCFGGWSEFCCDFKFYTSHYKSPNKTGDIALITKLKPRSIGGALQELFSEADVYSISFQESANLSPGQKTGIIAAQLLADYMFFEGNTEKCSQDDSAIYCYCFYCLCIGALIPCEIIIPKGGN